MRADAEQIFAVVNGIVVGAFLAIGILVDGNGQVCGLGEMASSVLMVALFLLGTLCAIALAVIGKGASRVYAILALAVYVALTLPAFLG